MGRPGAGTLALLAALVAGLGAPGAAFGHAQLEGTQPARGATVERGPDAVAFRFNEPVEGTFGAVRVFDARGRRVDSGDAFHPNGDGPRIAVHLRPRLRDGTYTATYRVISADGHPVSGGFVFSIGSAGIAPRQTVAELVAGGRTGAVTETLFGVARGLQYAALAVALGGLAFLLWSWLPTLTSLGGGDPRWLAASEAFARRLFTAEAAAAAVGAISAALAVVMQGATAAGISGFAALRPHVVEQVLSTRFGTIWGIAVVTWVLSGAVALAGRWAVERAPRHAPMLARAELGATGVAMLPSSGATLLAPLGLLLAFAVLVPALGGHAATQNPTWVLVPSTVAHVLAMGAWAGGLTALLFVLPAATRRLEPGERARLLAGTLARFSSLAIVAVATILATGLIQAYVYVRTPAHLLDTAFGRAVLVKALLLVALVALGAYNRRRSVPDLRRIAEAGEPPGRAGLLVRRALRAEVALIVAVLGVTAALASYAPSIAVQAGPFSATKPIGPAQLQMTLDPARAGANQIHLYLLDPSDGSQFTRAKEVTVSETLPGKGIGPLHDAASKAGPGHYIVSSALLGVPGTWRIAITVRVSKFDEYTTTVDVPVS